MQRTVSLTALSPRVSRTTCLDSFAAYSIKFETESVVWVDGYSLDAQQQSSVLFRNRISDAEAVPRQFADDKMPTAGRCHKVDR